MDYKEIPGFPNYGISKSGEIKNFETGRILKGSPNGNGYFRTTLTDSNGKQKTCNIHILMAITYLDHVPCGMKIVVDHRDNKRRFDNSLENLQLITNRENSSKDKKGTSKYTGVFWNSQNKKWRARI